ncbi:SDR family oxidoreductase [Nocardiopsis alba]|uniref:SDR family oxidoreductase n=1 Tax=Nocardiopsis alba TaxID=53437 RepID=A0A7K2J0E3_9ACTN|nr:SDR family oxidoreductase [Nocardiopsis alba]MYR35576.1 SDR family oxidoreductase [Nocardiopsis alba]
MTHRELDREEPALRGRVALVTGVSRRGGIGYATARRLAALGADVFLHHFVPHDAEQEWGADDLGLVFAGVRERLVGDARLADVHADLALSEAPARVFDAAVAAFGHVDILVCNHALTGKDGPLGELDASMLDAHWAVDARSSILLVQEFLRRHDPARPGASITLMTSGQGLGPLPGEVAYAASKAALAGITVTLAEQLGDRGIRVNTVNPGPVDTGYLTDEMWEVVKPMFPFGRYGDPDDPARLIAWLSTDDARWITGQVLNTEGGFGRWRPRGGG